jgi:hypothetical protein
VSIDSVVHKGNELYVVFTCFYKASERVSKIKSFPCGIFFSHSRFNEIDQHIILSIIFSGQKRIDDRRMRLKAYGAAPTRVAARLCFLEFFVSFCFKTKRKRKKKATASEKSYTVADKIETPN